MAVAWWYMCVSGAAGALAGFQGIYERFRADVWKAFCTRWGFCYLLIRFGMAAAAFWLVPILFPVLSQPLWWRAVVGGVGAEAILRSQFYFAQRQIKGTPNVTELAFGPFTLLRFCQDFILDTIDDNGRWKTLELVDAVADQWASFPEMCTVFDRKLLAWKDKRDAETLRKAVEKLPAKYPGHPDSNTDKEYRHKLCYKVQDFLGDRGLDKFFTK